MWRDKSIVFLDENGTAFRFEGNFWHVQQIPTGDSKVIDIRSWADNYHYVLFLSEKPRLDLS